jgi:hypothetical protein
MPSTSLAIASASAAVSVVVLPVPCRTGPNEFEPAEIVTTFVPALRIWSSIVDCAPLPIETITITARDADDQAERGERRAHGVAT